MGIFKNNPNYYETGWVGTAEQFLKAGRENKGDHYSSNNKDLIDGALQAFRDGHPENLQCVLSNVQTFASYYYRELVPTVLLKATEVSKDKLADVALALEKIPEETRKKVLTEALYGALGNAIGGESFVSLLLDSGADANATLNGYAGIMLITAAEKKCPVSVLKLLHDKGASFDDAFETMQLRGYKETAIDRMKFYEEKIIEKTAAAAVAAVETRSQSVVEEALVHLLEITQQMQEQIADLTERVDRLSEANQNAPAPKSNVRKPSSPGM